MSMIGYNIQRQNTILRAGQSDVDGMSQMTGSKSVMIRQRGRFPKTIWQKGALYSTKKSRREISMGKSPKLSKKMKSNLIKI